MDKLLFKTLTSNTEINLVLEKIERYSGVRLPSNYVSESKVVGVFLHDQLAACYMLVTKPNFRSLMFVPDKVKDSNHFFNKDQYEMMEVNGLWIGPALKKPILQVKVWMHLIKDIFTARKKYVLLMRDTRTKSMEKFMNMAHPIALYEGGPIEIAGETTHHEIKVSYTTRWKIVLNVHKYAIELWKRQKRADSFAKQRVLIRSLKHSEANFV